MGCDSGESPLGCLHAGELPKAKLVGVGDVTGGWLDPVEPVLELVCEGEANFCGKGLGEDICYLVLCRNVFEGYISCCDLLAEVVVDTGQVVGTGG